MRIAVGGMQLLVHPGPKICLSLLGKEATSFSTRQFWEAEEDEDKDMHLAHKIRQSATEINGQQMLPSEHPHFLMSLWKGDHKNVTLGIGDRAQ